MSILPAPSRVDKPAELQDQQKKYQKLENVPARYREYPNFEDLIEDPAHRGHPCGKTIREAMAACEADLSGKIKGPVSRPNESYIDFFDGDGHPFDVKTPLSPSKGDKWEFDPYSNADTIIKQLGMDYKNKVTGEKEPVAVLLDTSYMKTQDRIDLWHQLMKKTKEDRSVLKRIFEVNIKPEETNQKVNPMVLKKLAQKEM